MTGPVRLIRVLTTGLSGVGLLVGPVLATLLLTASPSAAHGGEVKLEVAGDGAGGVGVVATWKRDDHPVEGHVVLTMTAKGADGRTVGPIALVRAAEGQSFYRSEKALPRGTWEVTVTATKPDRSTGTATVRVDDSTLANRARDGGGSPASPDVGPAGQARADGGGAGLTLGPAIGIALILAGAAVAVMVAGRLAMGSRASARGPRGRGPGRKAGH